MKGGLLLCPRRDCSGDGVVSVYVLQFITHVSKTFLFGKRGEASASGTSQTDNNKTAGHTSSKQRGFFPREWRNEIPILDVSESDGFYQHRLIGMAFSVGTAVPGGRLVRTVNDVCKVSEHIKRERRKKIAFN